MFYRSLIVFLFAVSSAIALLGQGAGDPVAYPTHPLPPIIVPWELGGPKYKLHTKDQDSAPFPPTESSAMCTTSGKPTTRLI